MKIFAAVRCPPGYKYDEKTKSCVPKNYSRIAKPGGLQGMDLVVVNHHHKKMVMVQTEMATVTAMVMETVMGMAATVQVAMVVTAAETAVATAEVVHENRR